MTLTHSISVSQLSWFRLVHRFCIWTFALTACWLVVGFPVVALLVIGTSLVAISLQAVLPFSAVMGVIGGVFAVNVVLLLIGATLLTAWGVYPEQLAGFRWLRPSRQQPIQAMFAACPLTCDRLGPATNLALVSSR